MDGMGILENFENWLEVDEPRWANLSAKTFSETVCENCQCKTESTPIVEKDNMGRDIFWQDVSITDK
jgi:hypothetical protein